MHTRNIHLCSQGLPLEMIVHMEQSVLYHLELVNQYSAKITERAIMKTVRARQMALLRETDCFDQIVEARLT